MSEKLRSLGAIQEMLKLAKNYISNGLPQVIPSICLRYCTRLPTEKDICMLAVCYRDF